MKKEEIDRLKKERKNPFTLPSGYMDEMPHQIMNLIDDEPNAISTSDKEISLWEKVKPWTYMTAMFIGAALLVNVFSWTLSTDSEEVQFADSQVEEVTDEYIDMNMANAVLDEYTLYLFLTEDAENE